jgi:NRPS condensation-like uncharacterized protein
MVFIAWKPEKQYNISVALIFDGMIADNFIQIFINKGIKYFKRLRQKPVTVFGEYYWKTFAENEALKQIHRIDELNTDDEILYFLNNLTNKPFIKDDYQYRLYVCENSNNQTIAIIQFDHSLCDGYGLMSLLVKLSDSEDMNILQNIKPKTFFNKLLNYIKIPFFSIFAIFKLYTGNDSKSPFKLENSSIKKELYATNIFHLNDIKNITKKENITVNDCMLGILAQTCKKYYETYNIGINKYTCIIPINIRESCDVIDLCLNNNSSAASIHINFETDLAKQFKEVKKLTSFYLRNHLFALTAYALNSLSNNYLPFLLSREAIKASAKNFDFVVTNLAGPVSPLYIGNTKISKILFNPCTGPHSAFLAIFTYMNKVSIFYAQDSTLKCEGNEFIKLLESQIENCIIKYK